MLASDLVVLLSEALVYLRAYRNLRHLRDFTERAKGIVVRAAAVPKRPVERLAGESWTQAVSGSGIDDRDRESDRAHTALGHVADALAQLANGLLDEDEAATNGAAWRLMSAPEDIEEARQEGAPSYGGIGDTLPGRLDLLAKLIGEVILARQVSQRVRSVVDRLNTSGDVEEQVYEAVDMAAAEQEQTDRLAVPNWFTHRGFAVRDFTMVDREPPAGRLGLSQILTVVPLASWPEVVRAVQEWSPTEREQLTGASVVMPIDDDGRLVPLALRVYGSSGSALPVTDTTVLADAAASANALLLDASPLSAVVSRTVDVLIAASRERVREARRDPTWRQPPRRSPDPQYVARQLRTDYSAELEQYLTGDDNVTGAAVALLLELCEAVANEDGQEVGLAAAVASIDVARIADTGGHYIETLNAVVALGLLAESTGGT